MKKIFPVLFLLASCSPFRTPELPKAEAPVFERMKPEKKAEFKKVDVDDVETAFDYLKKNKERRKETVIKGVDRAKEFEELRLKLIAFSDFNYNFSPADVEPFRGSLVDISAIFTNEERQEFIKYGAQDDGSIDKLYKEAKKGEENNEAHEQLKEDYKKQEEQIKKGSIELAQKWASYFFGLSAFGLVAMGLSKGLGGGVGFKTISTCAFISLIVGLSLLLTTSAINFFESFLNKWGDQLLLLLIVPMIIAFVRWVYRKLKKGNPNGKSS